MSNLPELCINIDVWRQALQTVLVWFVQCQEPLPRKCFPVWIFQALLNEFSVASPRPESGKLADGQQVGDAGGRWAAGGQAAGSPRRQAQAPMGPGQKH